MSDGTSQFNRYMTKLVVHGPPDIEGVMLDGALALAETVAKIETEKEPDVWLLMARDGSHLEFALLEFCMSDVDGTNVFCEVVFRATGYGPGLNELRHMWWNEGGYLNYPNLEALSTAFGIMRDEVNRERPD